MVIKDNQSHFALRMAQIASGFSRSNPLFVTTRLFMELQGEPEISHLMECFAPIDEVELRSCSGKEAFDDKRIALRLVNRHKGSKLHNRIPRVPYRCTYCGKWHLAGRGRH